jgi:DNA-binding transcriptional ArsR family regulator
MTRPLTTLRVLADEVRLRILGLLADRELCVCEMVGVLKLSQPLVSHHLRVLRDAGLLSSRRRGKWIYYTLARPQSGGEAGKVVRLVQIWASREGAKPGDRLRLVHCLSRRFGLADCMALKGKGCPHPERGGEKPKVNLQARFRRRN